MFFLSTVLKYLLRSSHRSSGQINPPKMKGKRRKRGVPENFVLKRLTKPFLQEKFAEAETPRAKTNSSLLEVPASSIASDSNESNKGTGDDSSTAIAVVAAAGYNQIPRQRHTRSQERVEVQKAIEASLMLEKIDAKAEEDETMPLNKTASIE